MNNNLTQLLSNLSIYFKLTILVLIVGFFIFTLVIHRQTRTLDNLVTVPLQQVLQKISLIIIVATVVLFVVSVFIL